MQTRVLGPPRGSGAFPRWGFLDKYAVNEYMPRAFFVTVAIVLSLGVGAKVWLGPRPGVKPPTRIVPFPPVDTGPMPTPTIVHSGRHSRIETGSVSARKFVPVPQPSPVQESAIEGAGSGPATGSDAVPGTDAEGVSDLTDIATWPSPDTLVVVEHEPVLITMRVPVYPEIARDAGIEGTVLVRVLVDTQGSVRDTRLLQGVRGLDEAALAAASSAVFRPALQQDRPVAVWVVVPIEFRLHD